VLEFGKRSTCRLTAHAHMLIIVASKHGLLVRAYLRTRRHFKLVMKSDDSFKFMDCFGCWFSLSVEALRCILLRGIDLLLVPRWHLQQLRRSLSLILSLSLSLSFSPAPLLYLLSIFHINPSIHLSVNLPICRSDLYTFMTGEVLRIGCLDPGCTLSLSS
jgi:hypothetical protein